MKLKKLAACALSLSLSLSALSAVPVFAAESDPDLFSLFSVKKPFLFIQTIVYLVFVFNL